MNSIFFADYYISNKKILLEEVLSNNKKFILPDAYHSFQDYCDDFRDQSKLDKISILERENSLSIFSDLISRFLIQKNIDPEEVGCIIYTDPQNSNVINEVHTPYYLQKKFGFKNALIFSLHQQCSSSLLAMGLSQNFSIIKGKYIIILSSCFAPSNEERYIGFTIIGDAVGIMVLTKDTDDFTIQNFNYASDGSFSFNKFNNINEEINRLAIIESGISVIMNLLQKKGLDSSDIFMLIPQNINFHTYNSIYARLLNLCPDKIFTENISDGGHLGDVDIIRNFKDWSTKFTVPRNKYIVLYGLGTNGADINYGALLLKRN